MGRYASAETHHQFQSIVLGGDLEYGGMPSFRDALKPDQVQSIQAYVLSQAAAASQARTQQSSMKTVSPDGLSRQTADYALVPCIEPCRCALQHQSR